MAYDSTNKKLYTTDAQGISTSEIAACLGDYRVTARGRDIGLLCTSPKINPWAKYKPTPFQLNGRPYVKALTYEQRKSANFGLNVPTARYPEDIKSDFYDVAESPRRNGWTHKVPDPANNEYFRLLDFDGYYHKAVIPFGKVSVPNAAINTVGSKLMAMMTITAAVNEEYISPSEIPAIADKYFAVQLRQQGGTAVRTATAELTLKEGGGTVEMDTFNLPEGYYDAIPFISPTKYDSYIGNLPLREYHPLPQGEASVVRILPRWYVITIKAYKTSSSSGQPAIAYSFTIENLSAGPISFADSYVLVKKSTSDFDDPLQNGELQKSLLIADVPANSTYEYPEVIITGMSQEVYNSPLLWFSFKTGTYVTSIMPMASAEKTDE